MYLLFILFFGSLFGISFMIGRKLLMVQNGIILERKEPLFRPDDLEEIKHAIVRNIKKYGYAGLVAVIRFYIRLSYLLKNKYQEIKIKIKDLRSQNQSTEEKREVSKFLRMISQYKRKIREIKRKVKEEENL